MTLDINNTKSVAQVIPGRNTSYHKSLTKIGVTVHAVCHFTSEEHFGEKKIKLNELRRQELQNKNKKTKNTEYNW